ncbi:AbrB/MazE/SpoVT family DNA-binding domain-containing protein [Nocardia sp. NPDC058640]|uniref:AbrB/MazE/SpoVT family DNA-binding domain-containing protein n=1 Tax=Nocardia sp. NPDC058640 TaxID=3346571 RepID=UPI00365B5CD3
MSSIADEQNAIPDFGLPLPALQARPLRRSPNRHLAISAVDINGRLGDRSALKSLQWLPRDPVSCRVANGLVVVSRTPGSSATIDRRGYLQLPADIRHCVGIGVNDRVLVVTVEEPGRLAIYPSALVREALRALDSEIWPS